MLRPRPPAFPHISPISLLGVGVGVVGGTCAFSRSRRKSASCLRPPTASVYKPSLRIVAASPMERADAGPTPAAGPVIQAAAGAIAGCVARCVVAPLDVVKIRLQVQLEPVGGGPGKYRGTAHAFSTILREEGLRGFWRGTVPALLLWVPYTAVQFAMLDQITLLASRRGITADSHPILPFAGGALAALAATVSTYPLDLFRTIMAAQGEPRVYSSVAQAFRGQLAARGVRGLYAGLGATVVEIIPYAGLQFGTYGMIKSAISAANEERAVAAGAAPRSDAAALSSAQKFLAGLAAGSAAKLLMHPVDVAKKRFQVAGLARSAAYGAPVAYGTYRSLAHCLSTIAAKEGAAGLYKGLIPNLIKAAPASGTTFMVFEWILDMYEAHARRKRVEEPTAAWGGAGVGRRKAASLDSKKN